MNITFFLKKLLIMFHESQTWDPMTIYKTKVIYYVYIDLIQSSSSNHWIKIDFDSKWTLNLKKFSWEFKFFLLVFRIAKGYHQKFSL
jgi:hypothetical protein